MHASVRMGMIARSAAVAWIACWCSAAALAQPKSISTDDLDFARLLTGAGYGDLARQFCEKLAADPSLGPEGRIAAESAMLDIVTAEAAATADPALRVELLRKAVADQNAFIEKHAKAPEADRIREALPQAYMQLGEAALDALDKDADSEQAKALRTAALADVAAGLSTMLARVRDLEPMAREPEFAQQYAAANYEVARLRFIRGMLHAPGDLGREIALEEAIEAFAMFSIDHGDQLACYEGLVLQGLCEIELGRTDDALENIDAAISVRESWEKDGAGRYEMPPAAVDVVGFGVLQKMKLLRDLDRTAEAVEAGNEFLATTNPDGDSGPLASVLSVRAGLVESMIAAGDSTGAQQVARTLVDADPNGPWGNTGRELLARASGPSAGALPSGELLRLAMSQAAREQYDDALRTCMRVRQDATGRDVSGDGHAALLLIGDIHYRRGSPIEAVAAYDAAAFGPVSGSEPADALWRAIQVDLQLEEAEGQPFYRKRVQERLARIAELDPTHPAASYAVLLDGRRLESQKDYAKAAESYLRVAPDSPSFAESRQRAGHCLFQQAQQLDRSDAKDRAVEALGRAEEQLRAAIDTAANTGATADPRARERLGEVARDARMTLVQLFLSDLNPRYEQALALIEEAVADPKLEPDDQASLERSRVQAFRALGRLDDAERVLETLLANAPDSRGTAAAAAQVARALDERALELKKADPASKEARELLERASADYEAGIRPLLANRALFSASYAQEVSDRVFAIALELNDVPPSASTFLAVDPAKLPAPVQFERAARLYEGMLKHIPSYRNEARLARCLGFLDRVADVEDVLFRLFESEKLVADSGSFDRAVVRAKPELIPSWVELGATERRLGVERKDDTLLQHALYVFESTARSLDAGSELWWRAKHLQIRTLMDLGRYDHADIALRSVSRNFADFDGGRYGLRDSFTAMAEELQSKATRK